MRSYCQALLLFYNFFLICPIFWITVWGIIEMPDFLSPFFPLFLPPFLPPYLSPCLSLSVYLLPAFFPFLSFFLFKSLYLANKPSTSADTIDPRNENVRWALGKYPGTEPGQSIKPIYFKSCKSCEIFSEIQLPVIWLCGLV